MSGTIVETYIPHKSSDFIGSVGNCFHLKSTETDHDADSARLEKALSCVYNCFVADLSTGMMMFILSALIRPVTSLSLRMDGKALVQIDMT